MNEVNTTHFTIDQLKTAHAKVKSGADFPQYIREIKQLGVLSYETYVVDGHTDYHGKNNHETSAAKYAPLTISEKGAAEALKTALKMHQQGHSDYLSFCRECAKCGIGKWVVDIAAMICTYYDKSDNTILVEKIHA